MAYIIDLVSMLVVLTIVFESLISYIVFIQYLQHLPMDHTYI